MHRNGAHTNTPRATRRGLGLALNLYLNDAALVLRLKAVANQFTQSALWRVRARIDTQDEVAFMEFARDGIGEGDGPNHNVPTPPQESQALRASITRHF